MICGNANKQQEQDSFESEIVQQQQKKKSWEMLA